MDTIHFFQLSSLDKVYLDYQPSQTELENISVLKNERLSYQIAYTGSIYPKHVMKVKVVSPIAEFISLRRVGNVPSELPIHKELPDENLERTKPGLFPDPLYPLENDEIEVTYDTFHSLWVSVDLNGKVKSGQYPIDITFFSADFSVTKRLEVEIIDAMLPPQKLIFTQWFHADCIADYYNIKVFSKKHWMLIDKFMKTAVKNGINMILTPIFTPPLDTEIGGERPTVQLVDVKKDKDNYSFDFTKLLKWIKLCKKNGVQYYEMAHLFTQWGAKFTPKIIALENGIEKRIFGWDVEALSPEYKLFLDQFLPELADVLRSQGIADKTFFHISDEPHGEEQLKQYSMVKSIVKPHLKDFKIIDALSEFEFYKRGIVENPIPVTYAVSEFIENKVPDLWTYYCCAQKLNYSNRFMSMPSYRNRIIGIQFHKYSIKGFLQWGYNFYYSQYSKYKINPFLVTDAANAFPSGDSFSVYPYVDGPIESIRLVVFHEALQDLRALGLLESFIGKSEAVKIVEEEAKMSIEFDKYPQNKEFILRVREKINRKIKELL